MFYYLALPFTSILDFFDRGGPVIVVLFILAIFMTTLLIERLIFFVSELKNLSNDAMTDINKNNISNSGFMKKLNSKIFLLLALKQIRIFY